jgi:class 3 adenylate cyclase
MISAGIERKLAAILSADVQGFSRLMGADEEATLHTLHAYREVTDALIQQHRGRFVGSAGDSVLAEFASVVDAVRSRSRSSSRSKLGTLTCPSSAAWHFASASISGM